MPPLGPDHLDQVRKELAERSLRHFIRQGWRYIDPAEFISNWHIDAMAEHLEAIARGEIRNLIINIPPRHMKSLLVSVAFPAWVWAQKTDDLKRKRHPLMGPQTAFLFASYAHTLSVRDTVKSRRLMYSRWFQDNWGDRFSFTSDQNAKTRYDNDKGGYRLPVSIDGGLTGEGGDIICVDDPHNVIDAESDQVREGVLTWWDEAMSSRHNNPKTGAYVIIMQRVHERDLTGHILAKEQGWEHLCIPARFEPDHKHVWKRDPRTEAGQLLWPERMGEPELRKLESKLGSYGTAGQLQQRPAPRGGGMFKRAWFRTIRAVPVEATRRVRAWDLAATEAKQGTDPDFTAGVRMSADGQGRFFIENVIRFREGPLVVEQTLKTTAAADGLGTKVRVPQDPAQAGKSQAANLIKLLVGYTVKAVPPSGDKALRASPLAAQAEAGNVFIVMTGDPIRDAWIETFLLEMETFPKGHDDQVDAAADAFNELALGYGPATQSALNM